MRRFSLTCHPISKPGIRAVVPLAISSCVNYDRVAPGLSQVVRAGRRGYQKYTPCRIWGQLYSFSPVSVLDSLAALPTAAGWKSRCVAVKRPYRHAVPYACQYLSHVDEGVVHLGRSRQVGIWPHISKIPSKYPVVSLMQLLFYFQFRRVRSPT